MRIPTHKSIEVYNSKNELVSKHIDKTYKYTERNNVTNFTSSWGVSTIALDAASSTKMVYLTTDYTVYNNVRAKINYQYTGAAMIETTDIAIIENNSVHFTIGDYFLDISFHNGSIYIYYNIPWSGFKINSLVYYWNNTYINNNLINPTKLSADTYARKLVRFNILEEGTSNTSNTGHKKVSYTCPEGTLGSYSSYANFTCDFKKCRLRYTSQSTSLVINDTRYIEYSLDNGTTWIKSDVPTGSYHKLMCCNKVLLLVSNSTSTKSSSVVYSTDFGITWNTSTLPYEHIWYAPKLFNGILILAPRIYGSTKISTNIIPYSEDGGVTWKTATLPYTQVWYEIKYTKDLKTNLVREAIIIPPYDNSSTQGAISYDGKTWADIELPGLRLESWSVQQISTNKYICLGYSMEQLQGGINESSGMEYASDITDYYSSTKVGISSDGINWKSYDLPYQMSVSHIIQFNGKIILFPYCHNYTFFESGVSSVYYTRGAYSSDGGLTWKSFTSPSTLPFFDPIIFNNKIILVHNYGMGYERYGSAYSSTNRTEMTKAYYSSDGITYTQVSLPRSSFIESVTCSNSVLVLTYSSHWDTDYSWDHTETGVMYSTNGTSFTATDFFKSYDRQRLTARYLSSTNSFVITVTDFNSADFFYYSSDGKTWTKYTTSAAGYYDQAHSLYNGAIIFDATNKKCYYSSNGTTWTEGTLATSAINYKKYGNTTKIIYENGKYYYQYGTLEDTSINFTTRMGSFNGKDWLTTSYLSNTNTLPTIVG